jgi:hypothetical protein
MLAFPPEQAEPLAEVSVLAISNRLSEDDLLRSMGIPSGNRIKRRLARYISEALPLVADTARPRVLWKVAPAREMRAAFSPFSRLDRYLHDAEKAALAAVTAGREWDERIARERDAMKAYILSAAGTALVRRSLFRFRRELARRFPGLHVEHALSPGNAGLPLGLQRDFERLLPLERIGIHFHSESLVMTPLASQTAIIALSRHGDPVDLETDDQPTLYCPRCPSPNCALRLAPFESSKQEGIRIPLPI